MNSYFEKNVCKTKYPILLVHGIASRDDDEDSSWGRIPDALKECGAAVFFGGQQAWGTIDANAKELRRKIYEIKKETGAAKVNIIAHSKGGLDCRRLISITGTKLVASLTTINTPHRGCIIADIILRKTPKRFLTWICNFVDNRSRKMGDKAPNCYNVLQELTTSKCKLFNKNNRSIKGVKYQSFASHSKTRLTNLVFFLPSIFLKRFFHEENDGLVNESSAKWDDFKRNLFGIARSVSHVDAIDKKKKKRNEIIPKKYIQIVADLKSEGL